MTRCSLRRLSSPTVGGFAVASRPSDIRQILGAVSEFDKAMVVAKLKGARERKRVLTGKKVEGRKSHAELHPEVVALVRQLRRRRPKGGQRSLREISAELAARGHLNERVVPFSAASINSMLAKVASRGRWRSWDRRRNLVLGSSND